MTVISLHIPNGRLKQLDELVNAHYFGNRAEAIRAAIDDLVKTFIEIENRKVAKNQFQLLVPSLSKINFKENKES